MKSDSKFRYWIKIVAMAGTNDYTSAIKRHPERIFWQLEWKECLRLQKHRTLSCQKASLMIDNKEILEISMLINISLLFLVILVSSCLYTVESDKAQS